MNQHEIQIMVKLSGDEPMLTSQLWQMDHSGVRQHRGHGTTGIWQPSVPSLRVACKSKMVPP